MTPLTDTDCLVLFRHLYFVQEELVLLRQQLAEALTEIRRLQAELPQPVERERTQKELDDEELAGLMTPGYKRTP